MGKASLPIITTLFILSLLKLISTIVLVALTFALDFSGFNMDIIIPGCSGNNYLNVKLASLFMILRVHTITVLIALVVDIIVVVLVTRKYCQVRSMDQQDSQKMISQAQLASIFIVVSLSLLFTVSCGGGNISLFIDNKSCTIMKDSTLTSLLIVSLLCLLLVLTSWILVMVLSCLREDKQDQMLNLNDVRQNKDLKRQEEAMSKQFQRQAKEYISNNFNRKEELMNGLLKQQYQVYNNNQQSFDRQQEKPEKILNQRKNNSTKTDNNPNRSPNHNPNSNSKNNPNNNFNQNQYPNHNNPNSNLNSHPNSNLNANPKSNHNPNLNSNLASNSNPYSHPNPNPNLSQNFNQNQPNEQNNPNQMQIRTKFPSHQGDEYYNTLNPIDEQLLFVKDNFDNISEKFDQHNFELDQQLQRAMYDQEQDLSPLQLKQLMNFTKNSFNLTSNTKQSLILQKEYLPGIKVNINFAKIKEHKQNLQKQRKNMEKQPNQIEDIDANKQEDKKQAIQDPSNKPVNEELAKILKITFYNNSNIEEQAYRPIEAQTECPISKYIEYEQGFEVVQSNDKGKNKKIQYSKEQVIFSKKRQEVNEGQQRQKATVRQRFNQSQTIRQDRISLFGLEWVKQQQRLRKQKEKGQKDKKRKLVDVIRSKYYE